METIKIKCLYKDARGYNTEEMSVPLSDSLFAEAQKVYTNFNSGLRPGESARILRLVRRIGVGVTPHDWRKSNLITIIKGGSSYDTAKCTNCGVTGKRYGLGGNVQIDPKYKADKYANCNWKK